MTPGRVSCLSVLAFTLALLLPLAAHAMSAKTTRSTPLSDDPENNYAIRLNLGVLNGQSRELVYDETNGDKISELIWNIQNAPMIGLSGSIKLPYDAIFNIGGWTQFTTPESYMEDYDWDTSIHPTDWTHYSNTKTVMERGEMVDANLLLPVAETGGFQLSGLVGFRVDHWKWVDSGGYYIYSSDPGFRDLTGNIPNAAGIIYEQWFFAPYLGLQLDWNLETVVFKGRVAGSRWAWAKDKDQHLNTGMTFRDYFYNIPYISVGGEISVPVSESVSLAVSCDLQKYFRTKGYTNISGAINYDRIDDGAGIEHLSWMTALSLEYRF